jgi:type IV pilus assembly protein PilX
MMIAAHPCVCRERGASLVVALIFLVIMAMLGVTVAGVTNLEERMASNTRDRDLALQAAEAALHDAEIRLADTAFRAGIVPNFTMTRANSAAFWETCFKQYVPAATCASTYFFTPDTSRQLPSGDSAGAVAEQPQFLIERKPDVGTTQVFLVTARAVGASADSIVVLQAEYGFTP